MSTGEGGARVDMTAMSDREFLALVGRRPGMYTLSATYGRVVAFLHGYEMQARRRGESVLDGFDRWIEERGTPRGATGWWGQAHRVAFPDRDRVTDLAPEEDAHAVAVLFRLLDGFLADRERGWGA
ncbi:hypothetical protein [Nocardiopsis flavescens]|nr:hypothetical protein [Nocardiopsis flavescens]